MQDDLFQQTAESNRRNFVDEFKNYGMLLDSMTPVELAAEIGKHFVDPWQAAIVTTLMARIIEWERKP
jgi:hypothetical protein